MPSEGAVSHREAPGASTFFVYDPCMATKTISLELDAYEKLKQAKRSDRESFSSVVRRARFPHETKTAEQVLSALRELNRAHPEGLLDEETLDCLSARAGSRASRARPG